MKKPLLLSALALSACAPKSAAPEASTEATVVELPAAEDLFQAHVDATNQVAAIEGMETLKVSSVMRLPAAGIEGTIVSHWAQPNLIVVEQTIPGIGEGKMGFDGENGWSSDNMMGPRIMEGQELEEALLDSDLMSDINFREWYPELETVGTTDFNGVPAYEVKAVARFGRESTLYFSVENGRMIGASHSAETAMGPMTMEVFSTNFQDFEGMIVPQLSYITTGPMTMELEVMTVEKNVELAEDFFTPPAEIQELLAEQAKSTDESAEDTPTEATSEEP